MSEITKTMLARTLPGQTGSVLLVTEPGQGDENWATCSKRLKWTRTDNTDLMQCYFMSEPQKWGYMERMCQLWTNMWPELPLIDEIREQFTQVTSTNEECISTHTVTRTQSCVDSRVEENMHFDLDPKVKELAENIINKMPAANDYGSRVPLRKVSKAIPKKLLEDISLALESISTGSISETNALIYSTATFILEEMGIKPLPTKLQVIPSWQLRLQNKIKDLPKKVSWFSERSNHSLERSKREATIEALESGKQQLVALSARLKRYTKEQDNKRMNKLFINNPSREYSQFKGELQRPISDPPRSCTSKFWNDIWEKETTDNTSANGMPNRTRDYPEWLTKGRTALLIKDAKQGPIPKNYRPITCLPTTWKLLSGIAEDKLEEQMSH
ncbi:uncharacterized protein [Watersipora subatra]|uniref:uncharacterized protein n=1 Tax=Watersipora subatra TaxID=2589382 RepID=UPI00355BA5AE